MEVIHIRHLWLWFLVLILTGCGAGQDFPEDRWIDGPWPVSDEWKTISFSEPLLINEKGWQNLYLIVDGERFKRRHINTMQEMTPEELAREYLLEHRREGWLLEPEVLAVSQDGKELLLKAGADFEPQETSAIVATGYTESGGLYEPPWPKPMEAIKAIRVRSERPFTIQAVRWNMDSHPDTPACWGPCPGWFTALDQALYQIESWFGMHEKSAQEG